MPLSQVLPLSSPSLNRFTPSSAASSPSSSSLTDPFLSESRHHQSDDSDSNETSLPTHYVSPRRTTHSDSAPRQQMASEGRGAVSRRRADEPSTSLGDALLSDGGPAKHYSDDEIDEKLFKPAARPGQSATKWQKEMGHGKDPPSSLYSKQRYASTNRTGLKGSLAAYYDELRDYVPLIVYTILALFTRLWRIGASNTVVWDEAHFGKFGAYYLNRTFYFDVHPPLGKMLVGLAGALSGFDGSYDFPSGNTYPDHVPFKAMRIFLALPGAAMVPLAWGTAVELGFSGYSRHIVTLMTLCDLAWLVISRFILLDSLLLFFTFTTVYCLACFHNYQTRSFSFDWWLWLALTGFSIGCVTSVKWIGLFATALVGFYTIDDLWDKFGDLRMPVHVYIRHWIARGLCLILLPFVVYLTCFKIHFLILNHSGPGDSQMSSLFQANLYGNDFGANPLEPVYGSKITLKNMGYGGGLLHSHVQTYPVGSEQQQVTCYHYKDSNNEWIITPTWESPAVDPNSDLLYLKGTDVVRLVHEPTLRNLHSHNVPAPVSKLNMEVSCYGNATVGDSNDHWQIEIVDDFLRGGHDPQMRIHSLSTRMRFRHVNSGCYLRAANAILPQWGFKQVEVSCDKTNNKKDEHTYWNIEGHWNDRLPRGDMKLYRSPFFRDFWHLNVAMMTSNNALVPDPDKEDIIASKPMDWPFLHLGMRMNGWSDASVKYYLVGNPIVWWGGSISLFAFLGLLSFYILRQQRKINDLSPHQWAHFTHCGRIAFGGWALHYLPFLIMGRVTYLHHYLPALFFSVLMVGMLLDHFVFQSRRFAPNVKLAVFSLVASWIVGTFLWFKNTAFGLEGPITDHWGLQTEIVQPDAQTDERTSLPASNLIVAGHETSGVGMQTVMVNAPSGSLSPQMTLQTATDDVRASREASPVPKVSLLRRTPTLTKPVALVRTPNSDPEPLKTSTAPRVPASSKTRDADEALGASGGGGSTERAYVPSESFDKSLIDALRVPKDRMFLLRIDLEIERFFTQKDSQTLALTAPVFPILNAYQRLLVHRLADTWNIKREVQAEASNAATGSMSPVGIRNPAMLVQPSSSTAHSTITLVKTEDTATPSLRLTAYLAAQAAADSPALSPTPLTAPALNMVSGDLPAPEAKSAPPSSPGSSIVPVLDGQTIVPPQHFRIMPRNAPSSGANSHGLPSRPPSSNAGASSSTSSEKRTLEEREAAYAEARLRIFKDLEESTAAASQSKETETKAAGPARANVPVPNAPRRSGIPISRQQVTRQQDFPRQPSAVPNWDSQAHRGYPAPNMAYDPIAGPSSHPYYPQHQPSSGWSRPMEAQHSAGYGPPRMMSGVDMSPHLLPGQWAPQYDQLHNVAMGYGHQAYAQYTPPELRPPSSMSSSSTSSSRTASSVNTHFRTTYSSASQAGAEVSPARLAQTHAIDTASLGRHSSSRSSTSSSSAGMASENGSLQGAAAEQTRPSTLLSAHPSLPAKPSWSVQGNTSPYRKTGSRAASESSSRAASIADLRSASSGSARAHSPRQMIYHEHQMANMAPHQQAMQRSDMTRSMQTHYLTGVHVQQQAYAYNQPRPYAPAPMPAYHTGGQYLSAGQYSPYGPMQSAQPPEQWAPHHLQQPYYPHAFAAQYMHGHPPSNEQDVYAHSYKPAGTEETGEFEYADIPRPAPRSTMLFDPSKPVASSGASTQGPATAAKELSGTAEDAVTDKLAGLGM
ncbi:glycosyltransferase family 39 protein [Mixia osmundae IAM 14324]|uniref:dolichyl-phosphate-mannose--protein mannosyltransferase n=1 Tax=Mixia osmundae (strain CBS 9802 / IAM 14324 / JCM 22182 / KY 12970) TaxID=764103 RepID=G7DYF7_MIXOS|nr:glycosyltransferase family 39 protein [Mixia osmundae IAM 14324]KEI41519.1 glycosyltransferase family 39 protein [Mixia osmundae IAM 14324]GAA95617.1 hypothetical protein E5Q_02273 [Mixia osmundae IAM 14324]